MPKKIRIPVPRPLAAEILVSSDRTCCVCRQPRKSVQLHHIDENPANNDPQNIAVLCLQCHDDTQLTGGFGRRLDAPTVALYRKNWLADVEKRRASAIDLDEPATPAEAADPAQPANLPGILATELLGEAASLGMAGVLSDTEEKTLGRAIESVPSSHGIRRSFVYKQRALFDSRLRTRSDGASLSTRLESTGRDSSSSVFRMARQRGVRDQCSGTPRVERRHGAASPLRACLRARNTSHFGDEAHRASRGRMTGGRGFEPQVH